MRQDRDLARGDVDDVQLVTANLLTPPVDFISRMHAYGGAIVLLGDKTPAKWRDEAKALFAFERPYFK